ncbi:very short patch repair endonuclease [candidate division KSB1 bacterium]
MDVHTSSQRSFNMSRIKGKNTKPEIIIRQFLWQNGFRYRLHYKKLPGKPDIVFPRRKKVIFIHGCFWHKHDCSYFKWPETNVKFWREKISGNTKRDTQNYESLKECGWEYFIIWECEIKHKLNKLNNSIISFLKEN